jgi:PAS domain S-box-containing protein
MVDPPSDGTKRAVQATGLIIVGFSVAVLISWQIHFIPLIQVFPALTPIHRMTALCFLLSGAALMLVATGRERAAIACALIVLLQAVLVAFEYALGADFGIDQLLGRDYLNVRTSHLGRMSPVTAFCFIGSSLALLVAAIRRPIRLAGAMVGVPASILFALGTVSLLGILLRHTEAYALRHLTQMSLPSSAAFSLLSIALLAWAWEESKARKSMPGWLPLGIGLGLAACVLGIWQMLKTHEKSELPMISGFILAGGLLGALLVAVTVAQTIQARKRSQELQTNNATLQQIFESSPDGLVMADRQGTIIRANQQAEKIFGYAQHELLGQPIENLVPEKLHDLHRIYRSGYYAAPSTRSMDEGLELRSKRKDGSEFPVEIALSPVRSGGEIQVLAVVRDITERKLGEDALRESEGNFVMLANCVPQMVWMCSPDGLNVYFNQRWVEYTGLTLEESYGRGWNTPFHPDDKQAAWDAWNQATTTGGTYLAESRLRAADGSYRWFLMRGVPLRDAADNVVRWFGTCTDIDDLKRAEQKLQESEARMRLQINRMPLGCIVFTKDLHILSWNPAAEQIFGFSADEVIGRHPYDCIVPPELQPQIDSVAARLMQGDETAHSTNENLTKDGRRITCEWTNTPLRWADGTVYGLLSMVQDVTERQQAQEALRQSEERFRGMFETSPLGLALVRPDRYLAKVNPAMCRMSGYSEAELMTLHPLDLTHPEDLEESQRMAERLFKGEIPFYQIEKRYRKKNGEYMWATMTATILRDREGRPTYGVGMLEDITQRKRAEAELRLGSEIFANLEEGVCLVRVADGVIVHANPKFEKMFGYDPDELTGTDVAKINAHAHRHPQEVKAEIRAEIKRSGVWRGEILHHHKDGTAFWCAVTVSVFHHPEFGEVGISIHQDITALKAAEKTLRDSEERFRGLFEQGPIGVALLGMDHRMARTNPAFSRMLGYSAEELAEMTPLDMTHPDDRERCGSLLQRLDTGEIPVCRMEKRYVKKSGEIMWVSLTASVVRDQEGRPLHGLGMIEDITERKRTEQQVAEQAALLDLARDSIAVRDLDGRIIFWNRGAMETYGWSAEEAKGHPSHDLLQTKFPIPLNEIETTVLTHGVWEGELEQTTRDGKRIFVASLWSLWRDEHGRPKAFLVINRDITERKLAETKLAAMTERLSLATRSASIGIWDWDLRTHKAVWDETIFAIFGIPMVVPMPFEDFARRVHPDDMHTVQASLEKAIQGKTQDAVEFRIIRPDGSVRHIYSAEGVVLDEHGNVVRVVGTAMDITERKQMEAQIEANKEQLVTAARLSALGMMAGGIAHEINNPLGIIHALASDLIDVVKEEGAAPPGMVARNSTRIRETSDRIARIIKSLRHISREGSGDKFQTATIGKILEETLEICSARFKANSVKLLLPESIPELKVQCREVQVAQILLNLLQNAFDAVVEQKGERWVRLEVTHEDDSVVISVTDSGPGIPPEARPHIMEPFFTTKPVGKGTGLGLSLSKNIAEEHGGKLEFGEENGRTRFSLALPVVREAEAVWN